jgi:hypothetical protein
VKLIWDTTWKYPLLLEDGCVIAKDNSPSKEGVILIDGCPTKQAFIQSCEDWLKDLWSDCNDAAKG